VEYAIMSAIEGTIKSEYAHLYPDLRPGAWYHINQSARELESDKARALRVEVEGKLVEVAVDHLQRRKVDDGP
jgi:hypothetical protein